MKKLPFEKYKPFMLETYKNRTWPDKVVSEAPTWCSVDLRDGNQALINPMDVATKQKLFKTLVDIGFKEIEVGFPASSETEYRFMRNIIDMGMCPDDVKLQVLCQAREELIENTFKSFQGAKTVIFHLYNSTSELQRRVVFKKSKKEIIDLTLRSIRLIKKLALETKDTKVILQYSPESYTGTENDFVLDLCEKIKDIWQPTLQNKLIFNLPATVEMHSANIYADRIEWFCDHITDREKIIVSAHTHNDRGQGIAASEMAMMAGAERVEGTLFGNGERTGNVDLVTMAFNLYSHGIDPKLNLADIQPIMKFYEEITELPIHPRHPYVGDLVYTAFSGSHQDAIKKGLEIMDKNEYEIWEVPYLHIDPKDLGFKYEAVIRINSQSGKGGVTYILESFYGFKLPRKLQVLMREVFQKYSDETSKEVNSFEVKNLFFENFIEIYSPIKFASYTLNTNENNDAECEANIERYGEKIKIYGKGNGPINAYVNGIKAHFNLDFQVTDYTEHTMDTGSDAQGVCYIEITYSDSDTKEQISIYGVGLDVNIITASYKAITVALNKTNLMDSAH